MAFSCRFSSLYLRPAVYESSPPWRPDGGVQLQFKSFIHGKRMNIYPSIHDLRLLWLYNTTNYIFLQNPGSIWSIVAPPTWCSVISVLSWVMSWGRGSVSRCTNVVSAHCSHDNSSSNSAALLSSSVSAASSRCSCCFAQVKTWRIHKSFQVFRYISDNSNELDFGGGI